MVWVCDVSKDGLDGETYGRAKWTRRLARLCFVMSEKLDEIEIIT